MSLNESELSKPLNPAYIKQRQEAGRSFSYIEAHHAIREANRIFGFGAWDRKTLSMECVQSQEVDGKWRVGYVSKVQILVDPDGDRVYREGTGFGQGIDRDLGRAHESAVKEAESDAMKRALMTFGDQFGLALYDKQQAHVEKPEAKPKAEPKPNGTTAQAADILNEVSELSEGTAYAKGIGMTVDDLARLKAEAKQAGVDWRTVAFQAKQKEIKDVDGMVALLDRPKAPDAKGLIDPSPATTQTEPSSGPTTSSMGTASDPFAESLTICGVTIIPPPSGSGTLKRKPDQRQAVAASLRGRSPLSAEMLAKIIAEAVGGKSLDSESGAVYDMALQFATKADDEQLAELQAKMGVAV